MILLGDQLIRDAGLAVFELVKNAYDADATICAVSLKEVHQATGGQIVVLDNGSRRIAKAKNRAAPGMPSYRRAGISNSFASAPSFRVNG